MASPITEWTNVLIHPLGLAGYILFLLFRRMARTKCRKEKRWLVPTALVASSIALVASLGLAYVEVDHRAHEAATVLPASIEIT
jgi:hypothetical protein